MSKFSCIIVEDEPLAAEVLGDYIKLVPFLDLKMVCTDAIYAMEILRVQKINLIFLDIHLPKLKGFEFLESLVTKPSVIITSAYKEYAVQAFDLNVLDYLVKPIRFDRFFKSVSKLNPLQTISTSTTPISNERISNGYERKYFFLTVGKKKVKLFTDEILYIESIREYIKITTKSFSIQTKFQLGQIEELLQGNNFMRIHRSFLIAKVKISSFSATDIEINDIQIPIGRSYKELVLTLFEKGL